VLVNCNRASRGCHRGNEPGLSPYVSVTELEPTAGRLIAVGNRPTADQHGTGERIGFFQDAKGAVRGLPIRLADDGSVLACAPPSLDRLPVTDALGEGTTVIGTVNEPTGWRGGTGKLELVLGDAKGIHWKEISGTHFAWTTTCDSGPLREQHPRLN